jgi:hypothetical protein
MSRLQESDLDKLRRMASLFGLSLGVILLIVGAYVHMGALNTVLIAVGGGVVAAAGYDGVTRIRHDKWYEINRSGLLDVFENRKNAFKDQDWVEKVRGATKTFRVLGVANHGYVRSEARKTETENAFRKCLSRKDVEVSILWLDPRTDHAVIRERQEGRSTRADIVRAIVAFWEIRSRLPADAQARMHFSVYAATPSLGITWHDEELVVTHYLEVETNLNSPGLILTEAAFRSAGKTQSDARSLTKRYTEAYDEIRSKAEKIDQRLLDELKAAASTYEAVALPSEAVLRDDPSQRARRPAEPAQVTTAKPAHRPTKKATSRSNIATERTTPTRSRTRAISGQQKTTTTKKAPAKKVARGNK